MPTALEWLFDRSLSEFLTLLLSAALIGLALLFTALTTAAELIAAARHNCRMGGRKRLCRAVSLISRR